MRISDWSSDVCSSDLTLAGQGDPAAMTEGNTASPGADPSYSHAHTSALSSDNTPARPFSPLDGRPPLPASLQPQQMQQAFRLRDHAASQPTDWQAKQIGRAHV